MEFWQNLGKVTKTIVAINLIIFVLMIIFGGFSVFYSARYLLLFGAQYGPFVTFGKHFFRIVTYIFVHGGFLHILFNTYALIYFGNIVEKVYGPWKFFVVYIVSGMVGGIFTQLFYPDSISVGASGAIFGLIGLLFGAGFRGDTPIFLKPITGKALLPIILINIFLGFTIPSVNNFAHIGGLLTGFTFGWLMPVGYYYHEERVWKYLFFVTAGIVILSFVLLIITDIKLIF